MHKSIFKSILSSDIDLRRCFLGNIVLSGTSWLYVEGSTMFTSTLHYASWFDFLWFFFYHFLKVGTHCWLDCLSGYRPKSKDWFPVTCGRVYVSRAPKTETSQCGAVERCWPASPPSAPHGSVRRSTMSMGRRSSTGSASETDHCRCARCNEINIKCSMPPSVIQCHWLVLFNYLSVFFYVLMFFFCFFLWRLFCPCHQFNNSGVMMTCCIFLLWSNTMAKMKRVLLQQSCLSMLLSLRNI